MMPTILQLIIIICSSHKCHSYNIDINSPIIKSILSPEKSSFGFSLSIFTSKNTNETSILVGSPTDQVINSPIKTSGAFYTCPLTKSYKDCVQRSVVSTSANSLFGYVIEAHVGDNAIYVCAPRTLKPFSNVKLVEGSCWEFNDKYDMIDAIPNKECMEAIMKNPRDYEYRNCLTGGAIYNLGNKKVLMTAPYSYGGRGLLVNGEFRSDINSWASTAFRVDNFMAKYQLAGISMSVGKVFRENRVQTIVVGAPGMPQSNLTLVKKMGFGQVMLIKYDNGTFSVHGMIFGDSFGSGFGYSVLPMDLNGDGYDELIVGAPYSNNNRGKVFIFWNQGSQQSHDGQYNLPLAVRNPLVIQSSKKSDNGQFGNCLQNIGDINKDTYSDFAIGSPFEDDGRGSVYIYLGSGDGRIVLSQKIGASKIDPDFRGFGFSIFGKNSDIDENMYPDILVGAPVSGHIVGLRTRPLMRIYAENMLPAMEHFIPYNIEELPKCFFDGKDVPCQSINVSIFYHYPYLLHCPSNSPLTVVNFTIDLDRAFLNSSHSKRVHFQDRSNFVKGSLSINCKPQSQNVSSNQKTFNIIFLNEGFFNVSQPVEIVLTWSMMDSSVPKRDYRAEDKLADLSQYPMMDRDNYKLTNKISFGGGCTPKTCKPILTFEPELELTKEADEYILNIGSSPSFTLKITVRNKATNADNRAYFTFVKVDYLSTGIYPTSITPGKYKSIPSGLVYAVNSPLNASESEDIKVVFSLTNDFFQCGERYIFLNVSLDTMSTQTDLKTVVMRIKLRMITNIDMKVSVTPMDETSYHQLPIFGISAITDEIKIGPRLKLNIALSNIEQASVVQSSKLVIYFPWEVIGNVSEPHGQYLLYLQKMPRFFISGGKRNIHCDTDSLAKLVNPIQTKIFESTMDNSHIQEVSVAKISLPKKAPKPRPYVQDLQLGSNTVDSLPCTAWEQNVLLDCMNGSARCVPIICDLGPLSRQSGEINLELEFRIWIHTFVENFIKYKFVQTFIPIFWVPEVDYDIVLMNPNGFFKSIEIKVDNLQKPKEIPIIDVHWAVLIAVVAGLNLLTGIIIILYKCKFFMRHTYSSLKRRQRVSKQY